MAQQQKFITPEYQRRQSTKYKKAHDVMQVTLEKGELEKFRAVGIDNKTVRNMLIAEYQRRTGIDSAHTPEKEVTLPDAENKNPMPKPQAENQEDIPFFE